MKNIVLLVVDTLRAKNLECYGNDETTAPFLSSMADQHIKIEKYYSNSPWTVPAHASIFTGKIPSNHGCTTKSLKFDVDNTLIQHLKDRGYTTYGLSENTLISPVLHFDKEFDKFISLCDEKEGEVWRKIWLTDDRFDSRLDKWSSFLYRTLKERDMKSLRSFINLLREKIRKRPYTEQYNPTHTKYTLNNAGKAFGEDEPFFLFVNMMPVHAPYTFTEKEKDQFLPDLSDAEVQQITGPDTFLDYIEKNEIWTKDNFETREKAYNASIRYTDGLIKNLWEESPDDTIFIVIGDHGELIGEYKFKEYGLINHHFGTYKEALHVPCIVFPTSDVETSFVPYDHTDLHHFIRHLSSQDYEQRGKDTVIAEYFGKSEFNKQFNTQVPTGFEKLYARKSVSVITNEWKYDLASEGSYLWKTKENTEENNQLTENQHVVETLRNSVLAHSPLAHELINTPDTDNIDI
jgi:arylsulfatase A-like enzyme